MTAAARRTYVALGRAFVGIGGMVALVSLLDRVFAWGFFRGSPVGTAAFLVVVGVLLLWTVRQDEARRDAAPAPDPDADADPRVDRDADARP
jgi:hypothetical protein